MKGHERVWLPGLSRSPQVLHRAAYQVIWDLPPQLMGSVETASVGG